MTLGASFDVAVIGSANADLIVEVPRRPGGGETLLGSDLRVLAGGKGANQAAAAARSGASTAFVGCIGADANGEVLRTSLSGAGVDLSGLEETEVATGTAVIFVTPDGENSIVVSPGANGMLSEAAAERASEIWLSTRVVVLSLEIPLETVWGAIARAAAAGARVLLNAAPATGIDETVLAHCDPLVVNEHEALGVLGAHSGDPDAHAYDRLATRLREAGAQSVVITLGADGAVVADREGVTAIPAHRVVAVDTTGAGDAFVGAVASELARGRGLREAARFATAMSALAVQRVGAQTSYAAREEVEALLADAELTGAGLAGAERAEFVLPDPPP